MNESAGVLSPEGEWYFSRDGQQSGPLSFAELKEKADEGSLMPRQDLVWKEGMSDWSPVGEISGLFERRAPTATSDDPFTPPETDYAEPDTGAQWPGARRRAYLIGILVFPFLWNFVIAVGLAAYKSAMNGAELPPIAVLGLSFVPVLVALYYSIERFPNLGMSRFWFLGNFVPFLNVWLGYRCFACPAGYAENKKLDGIGIFLAIIYWLLVLVSTAAIIFIGYMAYKGASDPDFQNRFRESFGPGFEKLQEQLKAPQPK